MLVLVMSQAMLVNLILFGITCPPAAGDTPGGHAVGALTRWGEEFLLHQLHRLLHLSWFQGDSDTDAGIQSNKGRHIVQS